MLSMFIATRKINIPPLYDGNMRIVSNKCVLDLGTIQLYNNAIRFVMTIGLNSLMSQRKVFKKTFETYIDQCIEPVV